MPVLLPILTSLYLLLGILYFGFKKPSYSHIKDTISELGQYGTKHAKLVNYGLFLPVGVLLFIIAFLNSSNNVVVGLSISLGIGYVVSAFFPCDPGSPFTGSGRQQVHNLGGFFEYAGGLLFLMRASEQELSFFNIDYKLLAFMVIVCIIITSIPKNPIRGLAQRIAELILFTCLIQLSSTPVIS